MAGADHRALVKGNDAVLPSHPADRALLNIVNSLLIARAAGPYDRVHVRVRVPVHVPVHVPVRVHVRVADSSLVNTAACVQHNNTRDFGMNYNADDRIHHFSVPIYMFHFGCFAR